jgi:hypothetical protein
MLFLLFWGGKHSPKFLCWIPLTSHWLNFFTWPKFTCLWQQECLLDKSPENYSPLQPYHLFFCAPGAKNIFEFLNGWGRLIFWKLWQLCETQISVPINSLIGTQPCLLITPCLWLLWWQNWYCGFNKRLLRFAMPIFNIFPFSERCAYSKLKQNSIHP